MCYISNMSFTSWKNALLQNTEIIADKSSCKRVIDIINNKKNFLLNQAVSTNHSPYASNKLVIGVDCEGVNLGVRGDVTLIQIAIDDGIYIFDVLKCPNVLDFGLKQILEDNDIIKVIHSCANDVLAIYIKFKVILKCVFDIQIAHGILTKQNNGISQRSEGLNKILQYYGVEENPMKNKLKGIYRKDQRYWAKRPLTEEMILYAAADVKSLTDPKLYRKMINELNSESRNLLARLCLKKTLIQNHNTRCHQNNKKAWQHCPRFQGRQKIPSHRRGGNRRDRHHRSREVRRF